MARRLVQAGRDTGDTTLPILDHVYRNIYGWERGEGRPTERYRLYYCKALAIPAAQFGTAPTAPAPQAPPGTAKASSRLAGSIAVAYRGTDGPGTGDSVVEREILMTAHESSDHAEQAGQPGLGDTTPGQLRADLVLLAHLNDTGEPLTVFLQMRRTRDRIYRLLDRKLWPREQTDLYFLLGCLNGLMGNVVIRLGYLDAAEELMRAGWAYANGIGHGPLRGQLRTQMSYLMYWRGRYTEGRDLAADGLRYVSDGRPGADLHVHLAKSAARLGDADTARQAIRNANEARERDYRDELLEMGGQFAISEATHHASAGAALATIKGAEGEAAAELERAIGLYDDGPAQGEDHWFGGKPLASIDLAVVRLRSGALDAAAAALEPALALPAGQRITQVTTRLAAARDELAAPVFRGSAQARDLGEQIEEFGREAITAGLHSLPGGPG